MPSSSAAMAASRRRLSVPLLPRALPIGAVSTRGSGHAIASATAGKLAGLFLVLVFVYGCTPIEDPSATSADAGLSPISQPPPEPPPQPPPEPTPAPPPPPPPSPPPPSPPMGSATLSWLPPTSYTDGTSLVIEGYRFYAGPSQGNLALVEDVPDGGISSYMINGLSSGIWFFAVTVYDAQGVESSFSNSARRPFPRSPAGPPRSRAELKRLLVKPSDSRVSASLEGCFFATGGTLASKSCLPPHRGAVATGTIRSMRSIPDSRTRVASSWRVGACAMA